MGAGAEAAAIIKHYLRQLTQASGRRWTEHNDHDMRRLAELLADDDRETITPFYRPTPSQTTATIERPAELPIEPPATEPARQIDTRVTTVLDRRERAPADDLDDPNYQRWRQQRAQSDTTIAQRMLDRERR
jgi:hypothetical protein